MSGGFLIVEDGQKGAKTVYFLGGRYRGTA